MKKATLILFALALIAFVPLALAGDTQSGNGTRRIHKATVNYVYSANR